MSYYKQLGIGISSYNRPTEIQRLVKSIEHYTHAPYRLWIVDGFSAQATLRELKAIENAGRATVIYSQHWTGAGFNVFNALLDIAQEYREECPYFVRLDDDLEITTDGWEEQIISIMDSDPAVGLICCKRGNVRFPPSNEGYIRQCKAEFIALRSAILPVVGRFIERDDKGNILAYSMDSEFTERLGYYGYKIRQIPDVYTCPADCGTESRRSSFAGECEVLDAAMANAQEFWGNIEKRRADFMGADKIENSLA